MNTTCVFCGSECHPAPTERGWSQIDAEKGLHFDCARKVADQGDNILRAELTEIGLAPVNRQTEDANLSRTIMLILEKHIYVTGQVQGFVVHGAIAIDKIRALIHQESILFGTWYSGMDNKKVINAYNRYWAEVRGGQKIEQENEQEIFDSWRVLATRFVGIIDPSDFKKAIEKAMADYHPPIKKTA